MQDLWLNLDKITALVKSEKPKVLMLDFDGTLVPIAQSPQKAKLPSKTKKLLEKLCAKKGFYLALISGRKLSDIKEKIKLPNIIYAGNHGLEGEIFEKKCSFPIPKKKLVILRKIKKQLDKIAYRFAGIFVEDKSLALSFHYRLANKQRLLEIKLLFRTTLRPFVKDGLVSIIKGKMVFDIYPKVEWNKGYFAKLVTEEIRMRKGTMPVLIFIGDDITDEDVFRKFKNEITIKVGKVPKSNAKYRLKDADDVFKFLKWITSAHSKVG